jgi:hypothetical protein
MRFNERKVAQMAAFVLGQSQEMKVPHLKLMALLYLSDREAMRAFGWTISGDSLISMPHGPVLTQTFCLMVFALLEALMEDTVVARPGGWGEWISSNKMNHELSLRQPLDADALDELAPAEIEVLKAVWDKFADMDKWAICYWTRQNCAEWKDPKDGPYRTIQYDALARAVGFDDASAKAVAEQIQAEHAIARIFATIA